MERTRPPRAVVSVLQANELAGRVVGAPKAPCDHPLQLVCVHGAVGEVREEVGVHSRDLQVCGVEEQVQGACSTSYLCPVCSSPALPWRLPP